MVISFNQAGAFKGPEQGKNVLDNPTSLQFGPDGRLYVSEQNGTINAFSVALKDGKYIATAVEEINLIKKIQNHDDDGSINDAIRNRQVTGIVTTGTAENPVLYVSSSDPRITANGETNLDTNSGVITRLTWNGSNWDVVDIIRGLPRSEENHATNGLVLNPEGTKLFVAQGGNTNNGAPSSFFSYTGEYALSGTVLEVDLNDINSRPILTDNSPGQNGRQYIYNLPTLDDPNRANDGVVEDANGLDVAGPWGGNDGLNMAILPADAPLRIYADGFRNHFDLTMTPDGKLYTVDNGSNAKLGGNPKTENGDIDSDGIAGEALNDPNDGGTGDPEPLFLIEEGGYYGHPTPIRANQNQAWTAFNDSGSPDTSLAVNTVTDLSARVPTSVQVASGFLIDPSKFAALEGLSPTEQTTRLLESGERVERSSVESNKIVAVGSSTNGIVAYESGGKAFDGVLDGKLLVTQFNGNVTLFNLNNAGDGLTAVLEEGVDGIFGTNDDVVQQGGADGVLEVANVPLSLPLDVTVGPEGTLWVAELGGDKITVLAPSGLVLPDDNDADDDGIININDPFLRDASNGTDVVITPGQTYLWDFDPNQDGNRPGVDGFGGGLTGVMIDGETDFEAFLQAPSSLQGQVVNLDNVKFITAAGGGNTVIEKVSSGDPFTSSNSGEFLFHTGVSLGDNVGTATIKWSMFNPAAEITGDFQQIGGYVGTGDQSNYLKVVAVSDGDNTGIQVLLEDDDAIAQTYTLPSPSIFDPSQIPTNPAPGKIFIELEIDVLDESATPTVSYETTAGLQTVKGTAVSLAGTNVLKAIKGNIQIQGQDSGLAVGLFSTNVGEPEASRFQAVFDDIEITATEAQFGPEAVKDTVFTGVNTLLTIPVAQLLANDFDINPEDTLTVTSVKNAQNGSAVLNNNGTAGDAGDDFVTFIPTANFNGNATFDYAISDGTSSDTTDVTVIVNNETVLYRVNAGGSEVAALVSDPVNLAWAANAGLGAQSGDGFSVNVGIISTHGIDNQDEPDARDASLPNYVPYEVFDFERWDLGVAPEMQWNFDVTPGDTYRVNLFMRDGFSGTSAASQRVFDIEIEGTEYFSGIDLSGTYGDQVAAMLTQTLTVDDDSLDIEFLHNVQNPLINAIEIIQVGAVIPPSLPTDPPSPPVTPPSPPVTPPSPPVTPPSPPVTPPSPPVTPSSPPVTPPSPANTDGRIEEQLLALYTFDEGSGSIIKDVSGVGSALNLTIDDITGITWGDGSITLDDPTRITSGSAATKLIDGLTATNEITIEAWLTPDNLAQKGPARIVTLSTDVKNRNFTLAQDSDAYNVRFRTSTTNNNGKPALSTPDNSVTTDLTHLIYTREADGTTAYYLNGELVTSEERSGDFSNWNDSYQLGIGNEFGAQRGWLGTLDLVAIYSQSFDLSEVTQNFAAGADGLG